MLNSLFRLITFLTVILVIHNCRKETAGIKDDPYPEATEQNIDSRQLAAAFNKARQINDLQGTAVARNEIIVAEEYFSDAGSDPDPALHVMSVTKSITSTLVGIAIEQGFIQNINQTVSDFFGAEVDTVNPALGQVTIGQLLKMTCRHNWKEIGSESEWDDFASAPDQLNYILEKPIVNTPGTIFNYSDGAAHLVSYIIQKATGIDASVFADQYLFEPMGLGERIWYADNRVIPYGGVGLCIGIHDMVNIGYLYLNEGFFNDQQIVPADWINTVSSFQIATGNVIPYLSDYGYFWWLGTEVSSF